MFIHKKGQESVEIKFLVNQDLLPVRKYFFMFQQKCTIVTGAKFLGGQDIFLSSIMKDIRPSSPDLGPYVTDVTSFLPIHNHKKFATQ